MHVLILGKGFLGKAIHKYLNENEGTTAIIYSRRELDYGSFEQLYSNIYSIALNSSNYDVVINASGYTGIPNIDAAEDDRQKCWELNVMNPINIARVCKAVNIPLIHISSGCIYSGYDKEYEENDIPNFGMFNKYSSFYSKTKHAAEMFLAETPSYLLRIRMPFIGNNSQRNYLNKILNYNNLISMNNSMTNVEDFCIFIYKFVKKFFYMEFGAYNVVNEGYTNAKEVVDIMKKYGLENPNHKFIKIEELNTKAPRSNCILSTDKIKYYNLQLPTVQESLNKAIKQLVENR